MLDEMAVSSKERPGPRAGVLLAGSVAVGATLLTLSWWDEIDNPFWQLSSPLAVFASWVAVVAWIRRLRWLAIPSHVLSLFAPWGFWYFGPIAAVGLAIAAVPALRPSNARRLSTAAQLRVLGGVVFAAGASLALVSYKAVLDPESIFEGRERFTKDPWAPYISIGIEVAVAGVVLALLSIVLREGAGRAVLRALAVLLAAGLGFLMFMPFAVAVACSDGPSGGSCVDESWSTITGITFGGSPFYWPASLGAIAFASATTWIVVRRSRSSLENAE